MTQSSKKALKIAGIVLAVLLVALLALPLFINAERFRPMVEGQARTALGRNVNIGKLDFSLWRGGVVAKDIVIADDPRFSKEPFVRAGALKVGVELLPYLTSGEVRVRSVTLQEPQISLIRSSAGKWNFATLGGQQPAATKEKARPPVSVGKLEVENGRLTLVRGGRKSVYDDVDIEVSNFSNTSRFPFEFTAKTPGGGSVGLNGQAGPLAQGEISQTPLEADVKIEKLDLSSTGFVDPASGLAGLLDYQGKIKSDGRKLHSEGRATASKLRVVKSGAPANQPASFDYASDLDLVQRRGSLTRGDITVGQSKANVAGTFDTHGDSINVNARLKGDNMAIDSLAGLLPAFGVILPQGSQVQGGTVSTDLAVQGPIDRLVTSGPVKVSNTKVSGFNLKSRASALSALAGMPSASDLVIQALNSNLRVAPEGIRAEGINLVLPALGQVIGNGTIGANNSLNFKMRAKLASGGVAAGLSQITALGQPAGELPFLIQGTTSNPVFLPDVASAVTNTVKVPGVGAEEAGGFLGGLFGRKSKDKDKKK